MSSHPHSLPIPTGESPVDDRTRRGLHDSGAIKEHDHYGSGPNTARLEQRQRTAAVSCNRVIVGSSNPHAANVCATSLPPSSTAAGGAFSVRLKRGAGAG